MEASSGERLEALIACALMLGLRPGELTGLLWSCVDLSTGRLSVNRSLKEEAGQLRIGAVKRSRAGLGPVVPYQGRHTAATLLLEAGLSIEQVAAVLGDQPVTIYRHYRHRTREAVDAAAAPMERIFGQATGS